MTSSYQPRNAYINFVKATDEETPVKNLESLLLASQLDPKPPKVIKKSHNTQDTINRDVEKLHISPKKSVEPKRSTCAAEFPPPSIVAPTSAEPKKMVCNVYIPPGKRKQLLTQQDPPTSTILKRIPLEITPKPLIEQISSVNPESESRKLLLFNPSNYERSGTNTGKPQPFVQQIPSSSVPFPFSPANSQVKTKESIVPKFKKKRGAKNPPGNLSQPQKSYSAMIKINDPQKPPVYVSSNKKNIGPSMTSKSFPKFNQGMRNKFGDDNTVIGLILVEYGWLQSELPFDLINRSCSICHKKLIVTYEEEVKPEIQIIGEDREVQSLITFKCTFRIGIDFVTEGKGDTREASKHDAAHKALNILKNKAYTILIKEQILETKKINKEDCTANKNLASKKFESNAAPMADSNNIGNKLLRMMGWNGGALGKNGTGIEEPIDVSNSVGRNRLGLGSSEKTFGKSRLVGVGQFRTFLEQEIPDINDNFDVVFSPDFTKEERKAIHTAALIVGCRSKSYGKDNDRFIVVSRKISIPDLVKEILEKGETEKYKVVLPTDHFPFMSLTN